MRFGFVTCVELGLACMREIYDVRGKLELVVTLHDDLARSKSGRVYADEFCSSRGIDLLKIRNVNEPPVIRAITERELDWVFIIGWSQIARGELLAAPCRGVLGMHPTLLPEGRGRASIPWAILKGLERTGVTLFQLDTGVDTGAILDQEVLPLSPAETSTTLYARVVEAHCRLLRRAWPGLDSGRVDAKPQDESRATVWPGRTPEDGRIREDMTVEEAERLVRASTRPYPGAFFDTGDRRLRVWASALPEDSGRGTPERIEIPLSDGTLEVVEYDWEPLESPYPEGR